MIEERYYFTDVSIEHIDSKFKRAFLEIFGINHLRPSYIGWIFFNKKLPKKVTPNTRGYAGTFAMFGHPECWGGGGHCHGDDGQRRFDTRPSHPMTPAFKRIPVSHQLSSAISANKKKIDISIYVYTREDWPNKGNKKLLSFDGVQLVSR